MKVTSRVFIVLLCYAISSFGIYGSLFLSFFLALMAFHGQKLLFCLPFCIVLFAWICHFLMSLQWIFEEQINRLLMKIGTFCGVVSFCIFSIPALISGDTSVFLRAKVMMFYIAVVFPCLYLIIYILKQNTENIKNKKMIV
jgi:apolipoprotein N-acyltransferase